MTALHHGNTIHQTLVWCTFTPQNNNNIISLSHEICILLLATFFSLSNVFTVTNLVRDLKAFNMLGLFSSAPSVYYETTWGNRLDECLFSLRFTSREGGNETMVSSLALSKVRRDCVWYVKSNTWQCSILLLWTRIIFISIVCQDVQVGPM